MKDLLKFITCGSVDDGKSTLIGHLLYDAKLVYADQERALELESKAGSRAGKLDYSLLLDGLIEEREQGITIDVAYRYFNTDRRSFIVADCPGHEEYTRNMAVGASFAQLAVILIDASKGVLVQTRRHTRICALMGIRHFVFAVNKMDLVGYSEEAFRAIEAEVRGLAGELGLDDVALIPLSATEGDNVTKPSAHTPWYTGKTLLAYLEEVNVDDADVEQGFYLPVQRVCRPDHTFRGFEGQVEAGEVHVGDELTVLPSRETAHVKSLLVGDGHADSAGIGRPLTIQLDREVDVSRGCVLEAGADIPVTDRFSATMLWMDDEPLSEGGDYLIKLGTKTIAGVVDKVEFAIDVNTGEQHTAHRLEKNALARVEVSLLQPVPVDRFDAHRTLGEFILIDRVSNMTSACGTVTAVETGSASGLREVTPVTRAHRLGQRALAVVFDADATDATFLGDVESNLLYLGRYTSLVAKAHGEALTGAAAALVEAGVVALVLAEPADADALRRALGEHVLDARDLPLADGAHATAQAVFDRTHPVFDEDWSDFGGL